MIDLDELTAVIDDITTDIAADFFAQATIDINNLSLAEKVGLWPVDARAQFIRSLTEVETRALPYTWEFWARPKQTPPPGDWQYWLLLAGRGFGKTRTICEWANRKARDMPDSRGAIVARTAADARDTLVEGVSGILACASPDFKPIYEPSKRRLTWPNGAVATIFSADKPDLLRGPQFHWAIVDELAAWRYVEAWDMLQFGLRLGENPQCAIATTPRPLKVIKELLDDDSCVVTSGSTYENRGNLADNFFSKIITKYEGTRLGRQELNAELLEDVPGALWIRDQLDEGRLTAVPDMFRIVVGVDPAATTGQTGIVVVGVARVGGVLHGYTLADHTLEEGASPAQWGAEAVTAYNAWNADCIVGEINNGGNMVEHVIRTVKGGDKVNYKSVHASRGKYTRAEPVSSLYEQGRAHHMGFFGPLEDELCEWVPDGKKPSPNRLDAMVWGYTELMLSDDDDEDTATAEPIVTTVQDLFGDEV